MLVSTYTPTLSMEMVAVKYDSAGNFIWEGIYNGSPNNPEAADIDVDSWGNVYITGNIYSGNGPNDAFETIRFDSSGAVKWVNTYTLGQGGWDKPVDLLVDSMGYIYVTGESSGPLVNQGFLTIKYDTAGTELWNARFNNSTNSSARPGSLGTDQFGTI